MLISHYGSKQMYYEFEFFKKKMLSYGVLRRLDFDAGELHIRLFSNVDHVVEMLKWCVDFKELFEFSEISFFTAVIL